VCCVQIGGGGGESVEVLLSVEDTGIGMDQAALDKLWDPFEQTKASIARDYGGTGLGLSIVKSIVDILDGTISVSSVLGRGTTFTVRLNFAVSRAAAGSPSSSGPLFATTPHQRLANVGSGDPTDSPLSSVSASPVQARATAPAVSALSLASPTRVLQRLAVDSPNSSSVSPVVVHTGTAAAPTNASLPQPLMPLVPSTRLRVLIADDSDVNRQILNRMLRGLYDIVLVRNGKEALDASTYSPLCLVDDPRILFQAPSNSCCGSLSAVVANPPFACILMDLMYVIVRLPSVFVL
jgi:osomolarity two-component system sensor histidine kinase SLN1